MQHSFFFHLFIARPPASALNYLVDLVTQIQRSSGRDDPRSNEELARDLGSNPIILTSLKHATPQQTALNLFNHLYPGYRAKVNLCSANNLELSKPGLLESMLGKLYSFFNLYLHIYFI